MFINTSFGEPSMVTDNVQEEDKHTRYNGFEEEEEERGKRKEGRGSIKCQQRKGKYRHTVL